MPFTPPLVFCTGACAYTLYACDRKFHACTCMRAPNLFAQVSVAVLIDKFVSASAIIKMEKQEQEAMEQKNRDVR